MRVIADFVPAGHLGKCMLHFDTLPFNKLIYLLIIVLHSYYTLLSNHSAKMGSVM